MNNKKFYLISLGCAKNTVDSDSMASLLEEDGFQAVSSPAKAGVLIVNTCGFIQTARDESIAALQELAQKKRPGQILIAAGCLPQRFRDLIVSQVPGVDGLIGTRRWMDIVEVVQKIRSDKTPSSLYALPDIPSIGKDERGVARVSIQGGSAYLKIADGCRRPCAFCSIPLIKGGLVSRPPENIIEETRLLQEAGIQEVILIAQDTTDYGHDLGMQDGLSGLLEKMVQEVPDLPWIRILYMYPGYVTDRLIQMMADHPQILPYVDIPLQHAHPDTLRRMKRPADMDWVHNTLHKMRAALPGLALRTTFIVGYPGETEEEFNTLMDFIQDVKFDHLGAFPFSFEMGTPSEPLGDPIPAEVKQERLERLMMAQENISLANNQAFIGKTLPVLIEGSSDGVSVGRSYRDAPEIDGLVLVEEEAPVGELVKVQINSAMTHDLIGKMVD